MKSTGPMNALTGIRILAAGAVFLSHLAPPEVFPETLRTFMASGYNGVTLFFVLSGFLLTWNYVDRILPIRAGSLWTFVVARFARIYPVYIFALLVVILPWMLSGIVDPLMFTHALTLQSWSTHVERAFSYNGPAWSIGVEVFLYACFPLIIFFLAKIRHSKRTLLAVGIVVLVAAFALALWFTLTGRAALPFSDPGSAHRWLYRMPVTRLGDFALGAIAAMLAMNFKAPRWMPLTAQVVGAVSMVILMCNKGLFHSAWSWDSAYMLPGVLLLWGLATGPTTVPSRLLGAKPMVLLGQASFAFYLLHGPLLAVWPVLPAPPAGWVAHAVIHFALIMFMAIGVHLCLEKPAQRWLVRVLDPKGRAKVVKPEALVLTS
jgi:peptidoglycan/LPS O-acetylase OafA/YrhL